VGTPAEEMMKKAGIYDPYLDTLGGGERYAMTVAECLLKNDWQVDVFWGDKSIKEKIKQRLNLKLNKINFVPNLFRGGNIPQKWQITSHYDLIFYLSDGSIPFLFAKKNILHFQVPFHHVNGRNLLNQIKLKKIDKVVCNSKFTKKFIDREYGICSKVIYPPVDLVKFKPGEKENLIFSVGRFSRLLQAKRHDVLVDVFIKMCRQGLSGWKLVIAGGTEVGGKRFFHQLKAKVKSYPIELKQGPSFETLQKLYSQAKIFWLASGFGVNEEKEPERVEHFGIAPVEAMAAGCIPVIIGKGGAKEIIKNGENGFLWREKSELEAMTLKLIKEKKLFRQLSQVVVKSSQRFSKKRFCQQLDEVFF
jgi:glycosyltransferase involved in cell wall biosynthesis